MATQLQLRRGTNAQVTAFTGAEGEVSVNTTNDSLVVHDGSTAGGFELARADLDNVSDTDLNAALNGNTIGSLTLTSASITNLTLGGTAVTSTASELNILDGVTSDATELNLVDGSSAGTIVNSAAVIYGPAGEVNATTLQIGGVSITSTPAEINLLDGVTATTAELNILDGVTATTTELNYVDGVTSAIQTQLDAKAPTANPTFTGSFTSPGIDDNADAIAITIDSSENVLVGTTDAAPGVGNTNTGGAFGSNGYGVFSRTGSAAQATAYFNKNTNDGTIIDLRKDGTAVGSIGGGGTGFLTIGSGATNIFFQSNIVGPTSSSSGASSDGTIDLGSSGGRFKDLYLSGGAYLGGTGSANYLDDYEEGTWIPTINVGTFSYDYATYVKIGRLVHVSFVVSSFSNTTATTVIQVGGLPFPSSSNQIATGGCFHRYFVASGYTDNATIYHPDSTNYFRFYWSGTGNWKAAAFADFSSTSAYIYGSYSYYANA